MPKAQNQWPVNPQCLVTILLISVMAVEAITKEALWTDTSKEEFPPEIIEPTGNSKSLYIDRYDESVTVECKAKGIPRPRLSWFKNGIRITYQDDRLEALPNGTLILNRFRYYDNGYFQCKATNDLGTSLSQIIHIQAKQKSGGSVSEEVFNVVEEQPFSLSCDDMPKTVPELIKRWYDNNNNEIPESRRVGVDLNGTLHFAYILKEDSKKYTCGLVPPNSEGAKTEINLYPKGEIKVVAKEQSSQDTNSKPRLAYSVDNVKASIGRRAVLQCFFYAKPEATVTWKNFNNLDISKDIPRYSLEDFGRKLVIDPVKQEDEGRFSCRGTNKLGYEDHSITINVTTSPLLVEGGVLMSQTVPDNRDLTLHCKTAAALKEHLDMPRWYRNGMAFGPDIDPTRYKLNEDHTELLIKNLRKEDTANFQCNTSNSEGYKFFDAYLNVINSIIITKQPPRIIEVERGDVVDITVNAKGDACCPIDKRWFFNSSRIIDPEKHPAFQKDRVSDRLLFNTSLVTQEELMSLLGVYTCHVSDKYQMTSVEFRVVAKASKTSPVENPKSSSMEVWWIGLVAGLVLIIIAIIVVIVVYKSRYPGSTYKLEEQEIKHNLNPEEDLLNQSFHEI